MSSRDDQMTSARELLPATDGFAEGLSIARLHTAKWVDGLTDDGTAVRLFSFWVFSAEVWSSWEVWPNETSAETARGSLGELHAQREVDERGWHVYDDAGWKIPLWPEYELDEITLTDRLHVEHSAGNVDRFEECEGCHVWDTITELAWARQDMRRARHA